MSDCDARRGKSILTAVFDDGDVVAGVKFSDPNLRRPVVPIKTTRPKRARSAFKFFALDNKDDVRARARARACARAPGDRTRMPGDRTNTRAPSSDLWPARARAKVKAKYPRLGTAERNQKMRQLWADVADSEQCKVRAAGAAGRARARGAKSPRRGRA